MPPWVEAVERAYVAAAIANQRAVPGRSVGPLEHAGALAASGALLDRARAAAGAVASRYLAVGTPRSISFVIATAADLPAALLSHEAHSTWFKPREMRICILEGNAPIALPGDWGIVPLAEALAADIVCLHTPHALAASQLRRGTHVNALAGATLDSDLTSLATITHEHTGLPALAAGLVDGRQLDELTIFLLDSAVIALSALT